MFNNYKFSFDPFYENVFSKNSDGVMSWVSKWASRETSWRKWVVVTWLKWRFGYTLYYTISFHTTCKTSVFFSKCSHLSYAPYYDNYPHMSVSILTHPYVGSSGLFEISEWALVQEWVCSKFGLARRKFSRFCYSFGLACFWIKQNCLQFSHRLGPKIFTGDKQKRGLEFTQKCRLCVFICFPLTLPQPLPTWNPCLD